MSPHAPAPAAPAGRSTHRRRSTVALIAAICTILASLGALAAPASAVEDVVPARVAGANRVDTAARTAALAFPQGVETAVVATSVAPQDALVAAAVAGQEDAAMLLVRPDEIPAETADALVSLGVARVVIVGGFEAVSQDVEATLRADFEVLRLLGDTPYETASVAAQQVINAIGAPLIDGLRTVLLADGEDVPDALAASPAAYAGPTPVLYTETNELRAEARRTIVDNDVEQVIVLGGGAAVSDAVAQAVEDLGVRVERLAGPTRTETAIEVAAWTARTFGFDESALLLARGDDFPDALTAAQVGGRLGHPLILTATPTVVPETVTSYVRARCETLAVVRAVGGEVAVSTDALQAVETAAEACGAPGEQPAPGGDDALPTYELFPTDATSGPGTILTIAVVGQVDGGPLETPLDVVLFPCDLVEVDGDGSAVFTDADGDGGADGFGTSDAGNLIITGINNVDVEDDTVIVAAAPEDGRLGIQVSAGIEDCAAVVAVLGDGDGELDVDDAGRPTERYGAAIARFAETPDRDSDTQVYAVEPFEAQVLAAGETGEVRVSGTFDGAPLDQPLDLVLLPCEGSDVLGSGRDRLADVDGDDDADGFGSSNTGGAAITSLDGEAIEPQTVLGVIEPGADGVITAGVTSPQDDCTLLITILGNGNGAIDLDQSDHPVERYGVALLRWVE